MKKKWLKISQLWGFFTFLTHRRDNAQEVQQPVAKKSRKQVLNIKDFKEEEHIKVEVEGARSWRILKKCVRKDKGVFKHHSSGNLQLFYYSQIVPKLPKL